jgi:cell wall assembly regulator SMI1
MNESSLQMESAGPVLSEADIASLEQRIGRSLPAPYRSFLQRFNGGRPTPAHFLVPGWRERESLVNDFDGIVPGRYNDLEADIKSLRGRIPESLIPIADDPGGNSILIATEGKERGSVYFWDHEDEPPDSPARIEDYPNLYLVAQDFDAFVAQLSE